MLNKKYLYNIPIALLFICFSTFFTYINLKYYDASFMYTVDELHDLDFIVKIFNQPSIIEFFNKYIEQKYKFNPGKLQSNPGEPIRKKRTE